MHTNVRLRLSYYVLGIISITLATAGCKPQGPSVSQAARQTILVYGFSVEEEVLTKEIFPAFQAYWRQHADQEVVFESVFAGSEEITQAILDGAGADVAILSNEQHAIWLRINGFVTTDWHSLPHQGILSRSPLVIAVRPGNPLGIADWADLARPGVRVVHADPGSSGGAQWALLAEYGSAYLIDQDRNFGEQQVPDIWGNVVSRPISARDALQEFVFGVGDALATYEQDAMLAQARGAAIEIVMPPSTIQSEHVAVMVDRNVDRWEQELVSAFVSYLWSEEAQQALAAYFFRPAVEVAFDSLAHDPSQPSALRVQEIERPFTVEDLGGWGRVYPEVIRDIWERQLAPR